MCYFFISYPTFQKEKQHILKQTNCFVTEANVEITVLLHPLYDSGVNHGQRAMIRELCLTCSKTKYSICLFNLWALTLEIFWRAMGFSGHKNFVLKRSATGKCGIAYRWSVRQPWYSDDFFLNKLKPFFERWSAGPPQDDQPFLDVCKPLLVLQNLYFYNPRANAHFQLLSSCVRAHTQTHTRSRTHARTHM